MADAYTASPSELYARLLAEAFTGGDEGVVDQLVAPDFAFNGVVGGRAEMLGAVRRQRGAFPDLRYEIEELVAEGDRVAARYRLTGTDTGTGWEGRRPSGRPVSVRGSQFARARDGRLVEVWNVMDRLDFLQQLGATSSPAAAAPAAPTGMGEG